MASWIDLMDGSWMDLLEGYYNFSDYYYADYDSDNYTEFWPRNIDNKLELEAKIEKCVDDFETRQGASCGINQRELKQAMFDTQTGLLNCLTFKIQTLIMAKIMSRS